MVKRLVFDRGDIVFVTMDPTKGHEQSGHRPALVITPQRFNQFGDTLVAPITSGGGYAQLAGFAIELDSLKGLVEGHILLNKVRMLDLTARNARLVDRATDDVIAEVLDSLTRIING